MAVPNSYSDPFWISLASGAESSVGLPEGLLQAVLLRGEKSNANQVSEAGAKTPFQITPGTRNAALKKYGIDAYLSPGNAAEVAGLILKESLDRNKGDKSLAVAEYHGGVNRANWGPKTRRYVQRVTATDPNAPTAPASPAATGGESTFSRIMAQRQAAEQAAPSIANIYAAYESGAMDDQAKAEFEADVRAGVLMLPRGAKLKETQAQGGTGAPVGQSFEETGILPPSVAQAYASGRMARPDRIELEKDVAAGLVSLPPGVALQQTKPLTFVQKITEGITGAERKTAEIEASRDWSELPELNPRLFSATPEMYDQIGQIKRAIALAGPQEMAQILKANYPGLQVTQDPKGNFLLKSPTDNQVYGIKPGFQPSDVPRAIMATAAFAPSGGASTLPGLMATGAGTQALVELGQKKAGGTFDVAEVPTAGLLNVALPATVQGVRALRALRRPRGAAVPTPTAGAPIPGAAAAEAATEAVAPGAAPAAAPAAAEAVTVPGAQVLESAPYLSADQLKQATSKAAQGGMGSKKAFESLAGQAPQNQKTVEAAKRIGVYDHLQPDHTTTSQSYRELMQAIKSIPGSEARAAERDSLRIVGQKGDDLINEIGGLTDLSEVSYSVKNRLQSTVDDLEAQANRAYRALAEKIPEETTGSADNILNFIQKRAQARRGGKTLSRMEKEAVAILSPEEVLDDAGNVVDIKLPTYAMIDDLRQDIGAAARAQGPFSDANTGLAKKLYSLIDQDQFNIAETVGEGASYKVAKELVSVRKGIEDDMKSLFGKWLDQSLVGKLDTAAKFTKGDADKFIKILGAIPAEMRENVTASALQTAFGKSTQNGKLNFNTFARWYENLLENKRAHAAFMSNLPLSARKQISDWYRVSRGIADASMERIQTGRIQGILQDFQGPDSLLSKIYTVAQKGLSAAPIPGKGFAIAFMAGLEKNKTSAIKAADAMINTPEFQTIVRQSAKTGLPPSKWAIRRLAVSAPFRRYAAEVKLPREISELEKWITTGLQASKTSNEKPTERKNK